MGFTGVLWVCGVIDGGVMGVVVLWVLWMCGVLWVWGVNTDMGVYNICECILVCVCANL